LIVLVLEVPLIRIYNYIMEIKKGDIVNVKGEEWGMYVIEVEGDNVSYVEVDLIGYCKLEDIDKEDYVTLPKQNFSWN